MLRKQRNTLRIIGLNDEKQIKRVNAKFYKQLELSVNDIIGIGVGLTTAPLPHHRAYGSRTTAVRLGWLVIDQLDVQNELPKRSSYSNEWPP